MQHLVFFFSITKNFVTLGEDPTAYELLSKDEGTLLENIYKLSHFLISFIIQ
jgi:hypothetical protein